MTLDPFVMFTASLHAAAVRDQLLMAHAQHSSGAERQWYAHSLGLALEAYERLEALAPTLRTLREAAKTGELATAPQPSDGKL
jgi:hypothetical protein